MAFQSGDIAACFGTDVTSRTISALTSSPLAPHRLRWAPSHVAIVADWQKDTLWIESTTLCPHPCEFHQRTIEGPQAHQPLVRIADYVQAGGRVDIYRPTPVNQLCKSERHLLSDVLINNFVLASLPYDLAGALLSGTWLLQRTRLFPDADFHSLFCSELVAAVLMRLGRLNRDNPTRYHPGRLLRTLVRTGTYQFVESYPTPTTERT